MKRTGAVLEGLILLAIGLYAGLLVFFGDYWRFLNPKFKWLTATTAILLILVGVVATARPSQRPKLSRIIIFLLLLRVFFIADGGISLAGHRATESRAARLEKASPRVTMNGIVYVKINLAELFSLCGEARPKKPALRYMVRGIVKRTAELDRLGQFALIRNTVFCCLADAVGMGFRVRYAHVGTLAGGQWAAVYGAVEDLSQKFPEPGIRIKGMNITVLSDSHLLVADNVARIKEPDIPFIIEVRNAEPYAY